jgi:threonine dehydrogenase-like Zn-dependent dehydrogenase
MTLSVALVIICRCSSCGTAALSPWIEEEHCYSSRFSCRGTDACRLASLWRDEIRLQTSTAQRPDLETALDFIKRRKINVEDITHRLPLRETEGFYDSV